LSTSGIYGFRKNGKDKIARNNYDSYPKGLGAAVVEFCKQTSIEEMHEIFDRIELIDEDLDWIGEPTKNNEINLSKQNPLDIFKTESPFMIDSKGFIENSLFCEFGYIINLDTGKLECWLGYQREPDTSNRYGVKPFNALGTGIYYPCRKVLEVKLGDIQNGLAGQTFNCCQADVDFIGSAEIIEREKIKKLRNSKTELMLDE